VNIDLPKGTYVVAVSGGVDSMVLLDLLAQKFSVFSSPLSANRKTTDNCNVRLIIAHYDHGVRDDSAQDRQLVQEVAARHGLPFVYNEGHLGIGVSEDVARKARYGFLHHVRQAAGAGAIITAHHQDDMLETAVINILRGTGRRGLGALKSEGTLLRPLLHCTKKDILDYAKKHHVQWREDSTNQDEVYLRNYVRRKILGTFSQMERDMLLQHVLDAKKLNAEIDRLLIDHLHMQPAADTLDRHWFIMLPHAVACELMAEWLRARGIRQFDRKLLEKLVHAAKTYQPGKQTDIDRHHQLAIRKNNLVLLATSARQKAS
jgi:tRNA(Ile)-lysidine synthase